MREGMQPKQTVGDAYLVTRAQEGYLDAYEMLVQRHSGDGLPRGPAALR